MNAILPLIEQVVINGIMSKKTPFMRKNKFGLGLMVLSGLLFLAGVVFALIAGYGWLLTQFTQPISAIILAGFIMGLSILSALAGLFLTKKKQPTAEQPDDIANIMTMIADIAGEELGDTIKQNPKTAIMLASVAGFVAGDHVN